MFWFDGGIRSLRSMERQVFLILLLFNPSDSSHLTFSLCFSHRTWLGNCSVHPVLWLRDAYKYPWMAVSLPHPWKGKFSWFCFYLIPLTQVIWLFCFAFLTRLGWAMFCPSCALAPWCIQVSLTYLYYIYVLVCYYIWQLVH